MALKRELEAQIVKLIAENESLRNKNASIKEQFQRVSENNCKYDIHLEQLMETNKRIGDEVVRLEKEMTKATQRLLSKHNESDHWLNEDLKTGRKLQKANKKHELACKFIKSIL